MAFLLLFACACSKENAPDCLTSMGEEMTELRALSPFNRIELQGRVDVVLVQDSVEFAAVCFGKNVIDGVQTTVENNVLTITEVNRCDWVRSQKEHPRIEVHYKTLRSMFSESAGNTVFKNTLSTTSFLLEVYDAGGSLYLNAGCDTLEVKIHTGTTDVHVNGTCNYLYVYNAGYAPLDASHCEAKEASVHNTGTGDVLVRALYAIYYQIYDRGDIWVYGNPQVQRWHHTGSGQLFFKEP